MTITSSYGQLYKNEAVLSLSRGEALLLKVEASSKQEDPKWDTYLAQAEEIISKGKYIIWELDLGIGREKIFVQDSHVFFSYSLTIEEFIKRLWIPLQQHSLGVALYRGSIDFAECFLWTEQQEQHFKEKREDYPLLLETKESLVRKVFAAEMFSEYLHRLSSFLPENALPCCLLEIPQGFHEGDLAFLLSKERFQHIALILRAGEGILHSDLGAFVWEGVHVFSSIQESPCVGICFPEGECISPKILEKLQEIFLALSRQNCLFRIMEEGRLHELWNGIDDLIVLSSSLTLQGKRKLHGFLAAGGRVVNVGENLLNLEEEIAWVNWLEEIKCL